MNPKENRWWLRFLNVIYVILFLSGLSGVGYVGFYYYPPSQSYTLPANIQTVPFDHRVTYATTTNTVFISNTDSTMVDNAPVSNDFATLLASIFNSTSSQSKTNINTFKSTVSEYILINESSIFSAVAIPVGIAGIIVLVVIGLIRLIFLYVIKGKNSIKILVPRHQIFLLSFFVMILLGGLLVEYFVQLPKEKSLAYREYQADIEMLPAVQVCEDKIKELEKQKQATQDQAILNQCQRGYKSCINEFNTPFSSFTSEGVCNYAGSNGSTVDMDCSSGSLSNVYKSLAKSITDASISLDEANTGCSVSSLEGRITDLQTQYAFK